MKKISYYLSQHLRQILFSILIILVSVILFSYIADENILEKNYDFDTSVIAFVKAHQTPLLVNVMLIVTFFGSTKFLLPAYILIVGFFLWKHKNAIALEIGIIAGSSTLIMYLLKNYFHRHRPISVLADTLTSYSFPSGHAVSSSIFFGILSYLVWKTNISNFKKYLITFLLLLYTLAVGLSRIVLLVHYATDVIAGYCFAIAWLVISFWTIKLLNEIKSKKIN